MGGMLPGVETARRRRIHQSSVLLDPSITSTTSPGYSSRRVSFCLYAPSNHESPYNFPMQRNSGVHQTVVDDEKLDETAREAKERLDKKLSSLWKSKKPRGSKNHQPHTQVYEQRLTKSVLERFSWVAKLRWRVSEDAECAVCLENLKGGQTLMELPCNHRFHSRCLLPWLATNPHCPCCRLQIPTQ